MSEPKNSCYRCGRTFSTGQGLGLHQMHFRKAKAKGRQERLCPDRRSAEEIRDVQLRRVRLASKLGLLGRHP